MQASVVLMLAANAAPAVDRVPHAPDLSRTDSGSQMPRLLRPVDVGVNARALEAYSMIRRPKNLLDMLANIKVALDHDLPLSEGFYSDERLRLISGGGQI